jgi:N-acetyl-gamma-glutamyl-phosphate reductase
LIPLLKNHLIKSNLIIADSKSGVSGAGKTPTPSTHYCSTSESFKAYKIHAHRHTPEIEENLSKTTGNNISLIFTPHLVPMSRGMLSTIYVKTNKLVCENDIRDCLNNFYKQSPFIRIYPKNSFPDTQYVRGTNFCDIGFKIDSSGQNLILISAIDNLVKGAAGQAVQNLNIMFSMDETSGLNNVPYPL